MTSRSSLSSIFWKLGVGATILSILNPLLLGSVEWHQFAPAIPFGAVTTIGLWYASTRKSKNETMTTSLPKKGLFFFVFSTILSLVMTVLFAKWSDESFDKYSFARDLLYNRDDCQALETLKKETKNFQEPLTPETESKVDSHISKLMIDIEVVSGYRCSPSRYASKWQLYSLTHTLIDITMDNKKRSYVYNFDGFLASLIVLITCCIGMFDRMGKSGEDHRGGSAPPPPLKPQTE